MKRLMSMATSAALALALCFGSSAKAGIPVAMAPASTQHANYLSPVVGRVIFVEYIVVYEISDLPQATDELSHVDQAGVFDRTA